MKREKLENYKLVGSIHTLSIKTDRVDEEIQPELARCIKSSTQTRNDITMTTRVYLQSDFRNIKKYECYTFIQRQRLHSFLQTYKSTVYKGLHRVGI